MSVNTGHSGRPISESIDLKKLERESYRWLYLGTVLGVLFHSLLGLFVTFDIPQRRNEQIVPIELIIRHPRTRKPFILREIPRTRNYRYKSRHRSRYPSKSIPANSYISLPEMDITPHSQFWVGENSVYRETDTSFEAFDTSLWLHELSVPFRQGLIEDTGEYTARVIVDPLNKRAIEGFAEIAYVSAEKHLPADSDINPVRYLAETMNEYTNIAASSVFLRESRDTANLGRYPLLYITAENLMAFENPLGVLMSGSFFIIDNIGATDNSVKRDETGGVMAFPDMIEEIYRILPKRGINIFIRPLDTTNPVFHSFFDFDSGPPAGENEREKKVVYGIYMGRQLLGVYCPQGYGNMWEDNANIHQQRFGVNLVVQALAPGKWLDSDRRMTFQDIATGEFTMWHDNGQARFRASQSGAADCRELWLPQSDRIVSYVVNYNDPIADFDPALVKTYYMFDYNKTFSLLVQNPRIDPETGVVTKHFGGQFEIPWGSYNIYEAWHENGQRMYYYNYNERQFSEWDDLSHVLASSKK